MLFNKNITESEFVGNIEYLTIYFFIIRIFRSLDNIHITKFTATPVRRSTRLSMYNTNYEKTQLIQIQSTAGNEENNKTVSLSVDEKQNIPNSAVKTSTRKHLIQICNTLTNIENDSKQSLIFIPNKALNFD